MLGKALERAGYEVIAVENGDHALKELKKEDPPRLALLDWIMPGKDGVSVCREVRQRKERAYTYLCFPRKSQRLRLWRDWNPEPTTTSPSRLMWTN
jgi:CheY-like chemotaxis protein